MKHRVVVTGLFAAAILLFASAPGAAQQPRSNHTPTVQGELDGMELWLSARSVSGLQSALTRWQAMPLASQEQLRYELAVQARQSDWPALEPVMLGWQQETAMVTRQRPHHRQLLEEVAFDYPSAAEATLQIWHWRTQSEQLKGQLDRGACHDAARLNQQQGLPLDWLYRSVRQARPVPGCTEAAAEDPSLALVLDVLHEPTDARARSAWLAALAQHRARRLYLLAAASLPAEQRWSWALSLVQAHAQTASMIDHEAAQLERAGVAAAGEYLRQRLARGHNETWFATVRFASAAFLEQQWRQVMSIGDAGQQRMLAAALVSYPRADRDVWLKRMADSPHLDEGVREFLWEVQP